MKQSNNSSTEVVNAMHEAIDKLDRQLAEQSSLVTLGRDVKTVSLYKVNNNGQATIAADC